MLSILPEEVISQILWHALAEPWPFSFDASRGDTLLVCRKFHRLGREALYKKVMLVNTSSFHNFFCVDDEDWEAVNGLTTVKDDVCDTVSSKKWREKGGSVLRRREADWSRVSLPDAF